MSILNRKNWEDKKFFKARLFWVLNGKLYRNKEVRKQLFEYFDYLVKKNIKIDDWHTVNLLKSNWNNLKKYPENKIALENIAIEKFVKNEIDESKLNFLKKSMQTAIVVGGTAAGVGMLAKTANTMEIMTRKPNTKVDLTRDEIIQILQENFSNDFRGPYIHSKDEHLVIVITDKHGTENIQKEIVLKINELTNINQVMEEGSYYKEGKIVGGGEVDFSGTKINEIPLEKSSSYFISIVTLYYYICFKFMHDFEKSRLIFESNKDKKTFLTNLQKIKVTEIYLLKNFKIFTTLNNFVNEIIKHLDGTDNLTIYEVNKYYNIVHSTFYKCVNLINEYTIEDALKQKNENGFDDLFNSYNKIHKKINEELKIFKKRFTAFEEGYRTNYIRFCKAGEKKFGRLKDKYLLDKRNEIAALVVKEQILNNNNFLMAVFGAAHSKGFHDELKKLDINHAFLFVESSKYSTQLPQHKNEINPYTQHEKKEENVTPPIPKDDPWTKLQKLYGQKK